MTTWWSRSISSRDCRNCNTIRRSLKIIDRLAVCQIADLRKRLVDEIHQVRRAEIDVPLQEYTALMQAVEIAVPFQFLRYISTTLRDAEMHCPPVHKYVYKTFRHEKVNEPAVAEVPRTILVAHHSCLHVGSLEIHYLRLAGPGVPGYEGPLKVGWVAQEKIQFGKLGKTLYRSFPSSSSEGIDKQQQSAHVK